MTDLCRALDISYDANLALVDPDRFRAWCKARKAEGIELLIVNCWTGNATPLGAEEALRIAREAELKTACYAAVHDGRPGSEHVHKAMEGAGREWPMLEFAAIDCEEIADVSLHPETISDALYEVDATGQLGIIYTRGSYWRNVQGDTHQFAPFALWEAFFDEAADLYGAASLKLPFGGFAQPVGKQYHASTNLDGVKVDLSVFSREWLESLNGGGESMPELTPDISNALDEVRGWTNQMSAESLWELAIRLDSDHHPDHASYLRQALSELQNTSRVLDKAFGIGQ